MQLEIYQWLVPIIGLYYIVRTVRQLKARKRSIQGAGIWLVFWSVIIVLAIIPNEFSYKIAGILGFKNNVNAIIFVALGLLFLFVFYLSTTIERLENQLTELVRKIAIEQAKEEKEKQEQ